MMDIIREEDGHLRSSIRKQGSSYNRKLYQNKPSLKKTTPPVLISTKLATSTHINSQNDFIDNSEQQQQSTYFQSTTITDNNNNNNNNNVIIDNPHSNFLTQNYNSSDLIQLPKRVINTKISPTFKAVVNSLIAEKLLTYCKEYELLTDNPQQQQQQQRQHQQHILSTADNNNFIDNSSSIINTDDGTTILSNSSMINKKINFTSSSSTASTTTKQFNPSINTSKVRMIPLVNNYTTSTYGGSINNSNNDELQQQQHLVVDNNNNKKEIKFKQQQQQQQQQLLQHDDLKVKKTKSFNSLLQGNNSSSIKPLTRNIPSSLSFKSTLSSSSTATATTTTTAINPNLIRPATSSVVKSVIKRQTPASVKRKNLFNKRKNNKIGVTNDDEHQKNKENTIDGINNNADDADDFVYFSSSEIVMKSRSYENFNYHYSHESQTQQQKSAVSSASTTKRQQQTTVSLAPPPPPPPREPLPQYAGRFADMAVNYYINKQQNEDNNNNNNTDQDDPSYKSSRHDFDYISNIFKIRRYNLSDVKELEKAKNDLFKRYSFINDPYIKSRLTNSSSSSLGMQQQKQSQLQTTGSSFRTSTNNSRLSMTTLSDNNYHRKY